MPDCVICNDTGWKRVDARVSRCDCQRGGRTDKLLANARVPARYEHCEISNFDVLPGRFEMSMHKAKVICDGFVREFPLDNNQGLLFTGGVGTGKTHLAVGILKSLVREKGVRAIFYDYRELLKDIQHSYNPEVNETEKGILAPVFDADVLVLDELGALKSTEWVEDTVSHILNTRYNDQRTTIITTNLPNLPPAKFDPDAVRNQRSAEAASNVTRETTLGDRIKERMFSRLQEMCRVVELSGDDYRRTVRKAQYRQTY